MCTVPGEKLGEDGGCTPLQKGYILLHTYLFLKFIKYFLGIYKNETYFDVEFNGKSFFNDWFSVILDWYFF